mgnify:CR=1 FL=1
MKEEKKIRKKIKIEDLLPRDPVRVDLDAILDYVQGKAVLVTGGGGSIGSEICRQLAGHGVGHLIIFDIYENNAYQIQKSLEWEFPRLHMTVLIGSVRDERRLQSMFSRYRPDIVFHAAAHKHVPLMEDSPNEAIKNNVIGTLKTARTASRYHVKKFILISTDKAVNPTNIMGASKRLCEMVIQMIGKHSTTEFAAVRFGNVLGSNGSAIPLFRRRIFWVLVLLMICSGASEQAVSQWSSLFAEEGLGVSKTMGDLLGPCAFAGLRGVARLLYGLLGGKLNVRRAMALSAALCVGCYVLAANAPHPLLGLLGCALTGFSVARMWPGTFSVVARVFPQGGTAVLPFCGAATMARCGSPSAQA